MGEYRISNTAKEDLIRIHRYGLQTFGRRQADRYFHRFFTCFEEISIRPYTYPDASAVRPGYRKCVCGVDTIYFRIILSRVEIMAIIGRQSLNLPG